MAIVYLAFMEGLPKDEVGLFSPVISIFLIYIYIFIQPPSLRPVQVYDCIEVFAGVGTLSQCLSYAGFNTASLDIGNWHPWYKARLAKGKRLKKTCKGNPLDLLTPAGFAFLALRSYLISVYILATNKSYLYIDHALIFFVEDIKIYYIYTSYIYIIHTNGYVYCIYSGYI